MAGDDDSEYWPSSDEGHYSELATDYAATDYTDTDAASDDDSIFANASAVISSINDTSANTAAEGVQPYELFRAHRRGARAERGRPGPSKQLEEEDDDEDWLEQRERAPRKKSSIGRSAKRRRPTHISRGELPPQGVQIMQDANFAFAKGEAQAAVEALMQCIQMYPNFVEPYITLAAVYTDMKQPRNALHCYAIASHMKPSDSAIARSTAELSVEFQFYKQAIWAWSRYIRKNRRDHDAHAQRLECYSMYLSQQEACGRPVHSIARMAQRACKSMLREFPDDVLVSLKLPVFLYKLGMEERAIAHLQGFLTSHPEQVEPTHVNMLAQLHIERQDYAKAVSVVESTLGRDGCLAYVDLAVKMGVCLLHLGSHDAAMPFLHTVLQHSAADFHDLYTEAIVALVDTQNSASGLALCQKFVEHMQNELGEAANMEEAAEGTEFVDTGSRSATLAAQLAEVLQGIEACCRAAGDTETVVQGYQLLRTYGNRQAPDFADVRSSARTFVMRVKTRYERLLRNHHMVRLVGLLLDAHLDAEAQAVLSELEEVTAGAPQGNVQLQTRLAESQLLTGDSAAFLQTMSTLLDDEVRLDKAPGQGLEDVFPGIDTALRRRIERLKKKLAKASVAAPPSAPATDDEGMFEHPELDPRARKGRDRRKKAVKELDERAMQLLTAISEAEGDTDAALSALAVSKRKSSSRLRSLLESAQLFGLCFKALEMKAEAGDNEWVISIIRSLLPKFRKRPEGEVARRRAALQLLLLHARLQLNSLDAITASEERSILSAWPCSLRAWNLYCRWCQQQPSMPTPLVKRLRAAHPESLPLMMLRGHALSLSGSTGAALRHYFLAFEMLPENAVICLHIAVGYLSHAMSKKVGERHACILKAFAFFCRYVSLHTNKQEAAYNMGRAMHQLGLLHLAVDWYERALLMSCSKAGEPCDDPTDVRHEAAHNLCLIYAASGAHALASRVMQKYCVV